MQGNSIDSAKRLEEKKDDPSVGMARHQRFFRPDRYEHLPEGLKKKFLAEDRKNHDFADSVNNALKNKDVKTLAEIFSYETSLNFHSLCYEFDDEDLELLKQALVNNKTVTSIRFMMTIADFGAKAIGELLQVNRTLTGVELTNCKITASGAKYLANGISKSTLIGFALVGDNPIGDRGMTLLCAALDCHPTISGLTIMGYKVTKAGWRIYGQTLQTMPKLDTVSLMENDFSDFEALDGLMEGFKEGSTIRTVIARKIIVTAESAPAIAKMLEVNTVLETLEIDIDCEDRRFNIEAINIILASLSKNRTLKELRIYCDHYILKKDGTENLKIGQHLCDVTIQDSDYKRIFSGTKIPAAAPIVRL
jgi:hypothetical protein